MSILFFYKSIGLRKKSKSIRDSLLIGTFALTLGASFYSIYNSNVTLKSAERLSVVQNQPYITIEGVGFTVYDEVKKRNDIDKYCEYKIFLKNNGHLPASVDSMMINISFKNKNGDIVKMSTNPTNKDVIPLPPSTKVFVVGTGNIPRFTRGSLWINEEDAHPIAQGLRELTFNIVLSYSTPGYNQKWNYEMQSNWNGKGPEIEWEKLY